MRWYHEINTIHINIKYHGLYYVFFYILFWSLNFNGRTIDFDFLNKNEITKIKIKNNYFNSNHKFKQDQFLV